MTRDDVLVTHRHTHTNTRAEDKERIGGVNWPGSFHISKMSHVSHVTHVAAVGGASDPARRDYFSAGFFFSLSLSRTLSRRRRLGSLEMVQDLHGSVAILQDFWELALFGR